VDASSRPRLFALFRDDEQRRVKRAIVKFSKLSAEFD